MLSWWWLALLRRALPAAIAGSLLLSHAAYAVPPTVSRNPIAVQVPPNIGGAIIISLRTLGTISGPGPLRVESAGVLVDGRQINGIFNVGVLGTGPGSVCVGIQNSDYGPDPGDQLELQFSVTNLLGERVDGVRVGLTGSPGPTVPLDEGSIQTLCSDQNSPPIAVAGVYDPVVARDGQSASVTLNAGASSDPEGTPLRYQWYDGQVALSDLTSNPQLTLNLPVGRHTRSVLVIDESGDPSTNFATASATIDVIAPPRFTVDAGADNSIDEDQDQQAGELVTLSGRANPADFVTSYEWFVVDGDALRALQPRGATIQTRLADGVNRVLLRVTDSAGQTASDEVVVTIAAPPLPPSANAGADRTIPDSNSQAGEPVVLEATAMTPQGTITSYAWFRLDNGTERALGTGSRLETTLPDGANLIRLRVTNDDQLSATDDVTIAIGAPLAPNNVNAGPDRTFIDTNSAPGETVALTGSATTPTGSITSYRWYRVGSGSAEELLGEGSTLMATLPDGANRVLLRATNTANLTTSDEVLITIDPPIGPTVDAGEDRTIDDTDRLAGERVTLSGRATTPVGSIVSYEWFLRSGEQLRSLGVGSTLATTVPDGRNVILLRVTNTAQLMASDEVVITIGNPPPQLKELTGLTPNQRQAAFAVDRACADLESMARAGSALTTDQQDLRRRCDGLYAANADQRAALTALGGADFALARLQTLLFSNFQYAGVMDRLIALRSGARGLSLAGLNIMVDGESVPLAQLQDLAHQLFGGGASSDTASEADLLAEKWGLWMRGNYGFGGKSASSDSPAFDADQYALLAGIDYRLSELSVIGAALSFGDSSLQFDPRDEGGLDTRSLAVSVYGSVYAAENFYFDAILNVANGNYGATRNIAYNDGFGLVHEHAQGDTDGLTLSGGMSGGYDFLWGRFTLSPTAGVYYIDATLDSFTETGAGGLNLIYDEQNFSSLTLNVGLRMTMPVNVPFGVLMPHLRADFVREMKDDVEVFGVRLAADPNAASNPPILIETANPDASYWRFAAGVSAQFKFGISGYLEYQRLESFRLISYQDLSIGVRVQQAF
jgi:outer membrane autotransporter protein